jgi:hypothetical protein
LRPPSRSSGIRIKGPQATVNSSSLGAVRLQLSLRDPQLPVVTVGFAET